MSTQLTGASAKILFESPAQLNLKKKLLKEGNFEIVSSGPESATNLDKGITVVRTKQLVGSDAITDAPIYEYKEFPITHPRENIADVFRRRLPRDAAGQLTVPGLTAVTLTALNAKLEAYGIYLEPKEFTLVAHGTSAFILTAKQNCVIFYGKISFAKTAAVTEPKEVYEAEAPVTPGDGGDTQTPVITNLTYIVAEKRLIADVKNALSVTIKTTTGLNVTANVIADKVDYTFNEVLPAGTIISVSAKDIEEITEVPPVAPPTNPAITDVTFNATTHILSAKVTGVDKVMMNSSRGNVDFVGELDVDPVTHKVTAYYKAPYPQDVTVTITAGTTVVTHVIPADIVVN